MRLAPPPSPETLLAMRLLAVELPLLLFIAAGVAGTVFVADDFDVWRFEMAEVGVPLAVLYASFRTLYPHGLRRWPRAVNACAALLVALFASSVVSLVNSATTDDVTLKRTVERGHGIAVRDEKRGGLGWTFRRR